MSLKCYNCGHQQATGRFCDNCGLMIHRLILDPNDAANDGPDVKPDQMTCRCGHVQASGRFCDKCGTMFDYFRAMPDESDKSARCHQCGGMSASPICGNCGIRIPGHPAVEEE